MEGPSGLIVRFSVCVLPDQEHLRQGRHYGFPPLPVKNTTNWSMVTQKKYDSEQLRALWKKHQEARDELTALKQWMYTRYEVEAIREYDDLVVSNGDFDAIANCRVDEARRPGDADQFKKEMAVEQQRKTA